MTKTNKELLALLNAHLKGQEDTSNNRKFLVTVRTIEETTAYRVAYYNPFNKNLSYANPSNP